MFLMANLNCQVYLTEENMFVSMLFETINYEKRQTLKESGVVP